MRLRQSFIVIYSFLIAITCDAQNLKETFDFAKYQLELGQLESAEAAFQRVMFFDSSLVFSYESNRLLAEALTKSRDFNQAENYFQEAQQKAPNELEGIKMSFRLIALFLKNAQYNRAQQKIATLPDSLSGINLAKCYFYKGVLNFWLNKFNQSFYDFETCLGKESVELITVFQDTNKLKRLNPKAARLFSTIIPGTGQMYCGDFRNGINSLLLVGSFAAAGVAIGVQVSVVDAFLSIGPWLQRYYIGGIIKAEQAAIKRNNEKKENMLNSILQVIEVGKSGNGK